VDIAEAQHLVDIAVQEMERSVRGSVLVIEDEAIIAMDIAAIVEGMGHRVTGVARTHAEAVEMAAAEPPGPDPGRYPAGRQFLGVEAVNEILASWARLPVIFITAFPERLLTGDRPEPAFLINKPYTEEQVRSAVSQAMFFASTETLPQVEILVTAAEAYPALERAFLSARAEILAGFRVFDLKTRLRSPEALVIGQTWFDLVIHTLRRGVAIRIVLSDFDPVARPRLHRATWRTVRMFWAAAELAGPGARLVVVPSTHSAVAGIWPRLLFWPVVQTRLVRVSGWLRRQVAARRMAALREMPGVRRMLAAKDALPRPRLFAVPPLFPATHHQKLAVFDGEAVYIGGLDLDERFYDTPDHQLPGHETWHDVQLMLRGPVAQDAKAHLEGFLGIIEGKIEANPPAPDAAGSALCPHPVAAAETGGLAVHLSRTCGA
jgi:CheY-like chemotaxis protein